MVEVVGILVDADWFLARVQSNDFVRGSSILVAKTRILSRTYKLFEADL